MTIRPLPPPTAANPMAHYWYVRYKMARGTAEHYKQENARLMAGKDTYHLSVEQLEEIIDILADGLAFYADPETYFAVMIVADPPAGEFVNDYSDDHGHPQLDGDRYGKKARGSIRKVEEIIDKFSKDGVWRKDRLHGTEPPKNDPELHELYDVWHKGKNK